MLFHAFSGSRSSYYGAHFARLDAFTTFKSSVQHIGVHVCAPHYTLFDTALLANITSKYCAVSTPEYAILVYMETLNDCAAYSTSGGLIVDVGSASVNTRLAHAKGAVRYKRFPLKKIRDC
jgi:hypothetical protein